jgi:two-component system nitrate/nitrite response regulator NarL
MTVVMIVDDHHLIRTGVKNLLEGKFPDTTVQEATTIAEALDVSVAIDLVLLDINLPDAKALDGLVRLKKNSPATAVALISGTDDNQMITSALSCGADGFIPKSADPQILVHAVSLILKGEIFLPRSFLKPGSQISEPKSPIDRQSDPSKLTVRQQEVFLLMCQGLSNKEIARQLGLSESTIKTHVSAILRELGTNSRAKAIAKSIGLGSSQ